MRSGVPNTSRGRIARLIAICWLSAGLTAIPALAAAAEPGFDTSSYQAFLDRYLLTDRAVGGFRLNVVDYEKIRRDGPDPGNPYRRALADFAAFDPSGLSSRDA